MNSTCREIKVVQPLGLHEFFHYLDANCRVRVDSACYTNQF